MRLTRAHFDAVFSWYLRRKAYIAHMGKRVPARWQNYAQYCETIESGLAGLTVEERRLIGLRHTDIGNRGALRLSAREIGARLGSKPGAVDRQFDAIYEKLAEVWGVEGIQATYVGDLKFRAWCGEASARNKLQNLMEGT